MTKIKNVLREYFKWYDNTVEDNLPQTSVNDDCNSLIHVGKIVNSWVRWKPLAKDEYYDFKEIELKLNTEIHSSIKEYYNSYWFYQLIVDYGNLEIDMYPVVPDDYKRSFLSNFLMYVSHDAVSMIHETDSEVLIRAIGNYAIDNPDQIMRIPIGFEINSRFLVVIENSTGKVQIEDFENETFEDIADSLYTLLSSGN